MVRPIQRLIDRAEKNNMSFFEGFFFIYIIMFFRTFLENYANSLNMHHMSSVVDTFFHYPIFFSNVLLSSFIIARLITKEDISKVAKFIILCSFGLVVPPIIDLIVHHGTQVPYIFISGSYSYLFKSFITYFGGGAIGVGIKLETALAATGLGLYVYEKTKKKLAAFVGAFCVYAVIFLFLSSPALVFGLQNAVTHRYQSMNVQDIADFYYHKEITTAATSSRTFILENGNSISALGKNVENQYSITLSMVFLLIHTILLFWCIFLYSPKKFSAVLKNLRYMRIIHNFILILMGAFLGAVVSGRNPMGSLFDVLSFISLFAAFFFAWLFAVWENDEADTEIDKISNDNRPLVAPEPVLSVPEWRNLKYIFLLYALGFAFLCGLYTFVFILLFTFIYHLYSARPLHLKTIPGISSLLIAVNALLAVWMGFFMSVGTENLNAFPVQYTFGILIIFLLVENGKNIKDIEGDKKNGIKTLPVLLGETWGKRVTGFLLFLGALLVPFVFYLSWYTFFASIIFGSLMFFFANKKNYKEKYLFYTYFVYVLVFIFLIIL